jgi:hypothetical protein
MGGGLLQDTVSPMGDMVLFFFFPIILVSLMLASKSIQYLYKMIFFFTAREENKKEGKLSREETMEMLRADDSESEESDIFNAKTDR